MQNHRDLSIVVLCLSSILSNSVGSYQATPLSSGPGVSTNPNIGLNVFSVGGQATSGQATSGQINNSYGNSHLGNNGLSVINQGTGGYGNGNLGNNGFGFGNQGTITSNRGTGAFTSNIQGNTGFGGSIQTNRGQGVVGYSKSTPVQQENSAYGGSTQNKNVNTAQALISNGYGNRNVPSNIQLRSYDSGNTDIHRYGISSGRDGDSSVSVQQGNSQPLHRVATGYGQTNPPEYFSTTKYGPSNNGGLRGQGRKTSSLSLELGGKVGGTLFSREDADATQTHASAKGYSLGLT